MNMNASYLNDLEEWILDTLASKYPEEFGHSAAKIIKKLRQINFDYKFLDYFRENTLLIDILLNMDYHNIAYIHPLNQHALGCYFFFRTSIYPKTYTNTLLNVEVPLSTPNTRVEFWIKESNKFRQYLNQLK